MTVLAPKPFTITIVLLAGLAQNGAGEPTAVIDTHVHLWDLNRPEGIYEKRSECPAACGVLTQIFCGSFCASLII